MNSVKYEIGKSDVLKLFVVSSLFMGVLLLARVYFQMNSKTIGWFMQQTMPWVAITEKSLFRPWTLITHAITEVSVMVFIVNFIWLYFFGYIIENMRGRFSVISLMLVTAVITGLVAALFAKFAPQLVSNGAYYGMRACVIAVASAAVFFSPSYRVFEVIQGGIPIWIVGIIFLLLSLTAGSGDVTNIVCIIIAIALGYLYNNHLSQMFYTVQQKLSRLNEFGAEKQKAKVTTTQQRPVSKVVEVQQSKIDQILDKINEKGLNSLTQQEKDILDKYSRE